MPLSWTASHDTRRIIATARGELSAENLRGLIDGVRDAGLRAYAKLIDMRYCAVELHAAEIRLLSQAHFVGADREAPRGHTAVVIDSESALYMTLLYDERSAGSNRSLAIFGSYERAEEWLDAMARDIAQAKPIPPSDGDGEQSPGPGL